MDVITNCNIGSYLGVPIVLENGKLFGTLCAIDPEPYTFTKAHITSMNLFAELISSLLEKMKMDSEVTKQKSLELNRLSVVEDLSSKIFNKMEGSLQNIKDLLQVKSNNKDESQYNNLLLDEVDHIDKIMNELVVVTQPPSPLKTRFLVHTLVDEIQLELAEELSIRNIKFRCEIQEKLKCYADFKQLKQILKILLRNSVDTIETNGEIQIHSFVKEGKTVILLSDNREGLRKMFYENVESSLSKKHECSNKLALSICRRIINAHNGTLSIDYNEKEIILMIELPTA